MDFRIRIAAGQQAAGNARVAADRDVVQECPRVICGQQDRTVGCLVADEHAVGDLGVGKGIFREHRTTVGGRIVAFEKRTGDASAQPPNCAASSCLIGNEFVVEQQGDGEIGINRTAYVGEIVLQARSAQPQFVSEIVYGATLNGGIALEPAVDDPQVGLVEDRPAFVCEREVAIVEQSGVVQLQRAAVVDGRARVGLAIAQLQRFADQVAGAGDLQQAEGRRGGIALQRAIAQGDDAAHHRQRVGRFVRIGIAEGQRGAAQIDHVIGGVGVGAVDGLTQIGHARGVVGAGQGVGEAETGAGVSVVVGDRADTLSVARHRVDDVGDVDKEGFIRFGHCVAIDQHRERGAALTGRNERGGEAVRDIVVVGRGGGAVGGGDVEGGATQRCRCTQADGEDGVGGAAVAFVDAHIVDVQRGKSDRRLALVGADIDDVAGADAGIGRIRVIPRTRVQIEVGQQLGGIAIVVDVEIVTPGGGVVAGVDGGAAGGETVVAGGGDEGGIDVQVAVHCWRAGEDVVDRRQITESGAGVVPQDAVAHLHVVAILDAQQQPLHRVVGDGHVAHFRHRGVAGEYHQRAAGGGQVVVGEQIADRRGVAVVPEHGIAGGIAIGEEPRVHGHGHLISGQGGTIGRGIAGEVRHHDLGGPLRGHRAPARGGAVVLEHAGAHHQGIGTQRQDRTAFAAGRATPQLHVAHG